MFAAEFTKAFKVFDKEDSGYIAVGEIKYILTQLGERMEDGEVEELLKMANVTASVTSLALHGENIGMGD